MTYGDMSPIELLLSYGVYDDVPLALPHEFPSRELYDFDIKYFILKILYSTHSWTLTY